MPLQTVRVTFVTGFPLQVPIEPVLIWASTWVKHWSPLGGGDSLNRMVGRRNREDGSKQGETAGNERSGHREHRQPISQTSGTTSLVLGLKRKGERTGE